MAQAANVLTFRFSAVIANKDSQEISRLDILWIFAEHIELPAKLLDYFLRSNKSNINQICKKVWNAKVSLLDMTFCVRPEQGDLRNAKG